MTNVINICQTACFEIKRISSIRSCSEDSCYFLYLLDYCNCLLVGTPNSVIQPLQKIQNFAARLVLLAPRHHTQHFSWKNCTGVPFQNVINIKSLVCVSVLWMVLVLLTSLNCYMSTLRLVPYALLPHPHAENTAIQTQDSRLSCFLLLWTPYLEFTSTKP